MMVEFGRLIFSLISVGGGVFRGVSGEHFGGLGAKIWDIVGGSDKLLITSVLTAYSDDCSVVTKVDITLGRGKSKVLVSATSIWQ